MKNIWKIIAIIFIIVSVLELLFICWFWSEGNKAIEQEQECIWNVCEGQSSYYYDVYTEICYCYEDNEIVKQKFLG